MYNELTAAVVFTRELTSSETALVASCIATIASTINGVAVTTVIRTMTRRTRRLVELCPNAITRCRTYLFEYRPDPTASQFAMLADAVAWRNLEISHGNYDRISRVSPA
jgi:hypothetical protein